MGSTKIRLMQTRFKNTSILKYIVFTNHNNFVSGDLPYFSKSPYGFKADINSFR